jgi:hypothetical protein
MILSCDMLCDVTQGRTHRIAQSGIRFHSYALRVKVIEIGGVECYLVLLSGKARLLLLTEGL